MRVKGLGVGWVERSETHHCGQRWVSPRCAALPTLRPGPWALGAALLFLSACTILPLPGTPDEAAEPDLITYAATLSRMDGERRAQALAVARANWRETADVRDRARLGLAHGQSDHAGHDPAAGARNIREALAAGAGEWRENEREFLTVRAAQLEHLAERENELADARRETARLREDLGEAERKLQAIAEIERALGRGAGK